MCVRACVCSQLELLVCKSADRKCFTSPGRAGGWVFVSTPSVASDEVLVTACSLSWINNLVDRGRRVGESLLLAVRLYVEGVREREREKGEGRE